MRILLIYPDLHIHVNYPVGLGILSSVLKKEGHETRILHFNEELNVPLDTAAVEKSVNDFQPQLIAFSSVSNQFKYVLQVSTFIKRKWDIPILVGGIHATVVPEKVLGNETIDLVCIGEGEFPMMELVRKMEKGEDYSKIKNIGLKRNGTIRLNPVRPLINWQTYNALPFPDREAFNFREIVKKKHGWANVMASRGCLNSCTYCVNNFFHKMYASSNKIAEHLRYRRVNIVLEEIEELVSTYPEIKLINLDDDNIVWNKKWIAEFCEKYPSRIGLPFACNIHPTTFNRKIAQTLAGAGCVEVKIGLESGSERLRREVLKRPSREDIIIRALTAAEEAGLRAWTFNMIGIPTETKEEMISTAKLNAKIRPYIVRCSIFFPYEGTDLYDYTVEHQLLQEEIAEQVSSHLEDTALAMPQLTREEILKFKTMFKWYVDANSNIEAAPLFRALISLFEKLPKETWLTKKGKEQFELMDKAVDTLLRELKMEHYATRRHLDLNFTKRLNYELP